VRRLLPAFVLAMVMAVSMATFLAWHSPRRAVVQRPTAVVIKSPCDRLDPDANWFQWWWYGCGDPAAGGGGSGAS
jgi:hypothetical protein